MVTMSARHSHGRNRWQRLLKRHCTPAELLLGSWRSLLSCCASLSRDLHGASSRTKMITPCVQRPQVPSPMASGQQQRLSQTTSPGQLCTRGSDEPPPLQLLRRPSVRERELQRHRILVARHVSQVRGCGGRRGGWEGAGWARRPRLSCSAPPR